MRLIKWIGVGLLGLTLSWQAPASLAAQPAGLHTTIMVTTFADDSVPNNGTCSLREAVKAASNNLAVDACAAGTASDTIQLAAGVYRLNVSSDVSFEFGDLELNGTIQITGVNSATSIIDGNFMYRALDIVGGDVTLRNLQVRNGMMPRTGSDEPVYGHGILHQAGSLTIDSSLITSNGILTNPNGFGYNNYGGGLASLSGYLTITNSLIQRNRVRYVYMDSAGVGGGIYIGNSHALIEHTTFRESSAADGAAIYNDQGDLALHNINVVGQLGQSDYSSAISSGSGRIVIRDSLFANNHRNAISVGDLGSVDISHSIFSGNGGSGLFYCSYGGAISSSGDLKVSNSRFVGNWANTAGAIGVITGTATIDHSEFSANYTLATTTGRSECLGNAGAINTGYGGHVTIDTSTIAYNRADGYAAAIYHANPYLLTITNSTIFSNTNALLHPKTNEIIADDGPGIAALNNATVALSNTIVAGNRNQESLVERDCSGNLQSYGASLIEHVDQICAVTSHANGDLIGVQPKLARFDFHGGFTRSFSLAADSPAIDAGANDCGETDQRYFPRPVDGNDDQQALCDIGAFERGREYLIYAPITAK